MKKETIYNSEEQNKTRVHKYRAFFFYSRINFGEK